MSENLGGDVWMCILGENLGIGGVVVKRRLSISGCHGMQCMSIVSGGQTYLCSLRFEHYFSSCEGDVDTEMCVPTELVNWSTVYIHMLPPRKFLGSILLI